MRPRVWWSSSMLTGLALTVLLGLAGPVAAQDKPRAGGELVFVVAAEPPSFDAHREETNRAVPQPYEPMGIWLIDQYIMTFQWHRIVPHLAKVRGWALMPSHFLNQQLDTVWRSE
jgi:hypothetical protein